MFQWKSFNSIDRGEMSIKLQCVTKIYISLLVLTLIVPRAWEIGYTTGAQITILRGNASSSPIHCCDVTKPPYLISGELCRLLPPCTVCVHSVLSAHRVVLLVLRTHKSDVVDGSSGRRYVTDQWHNVRLLRAHGLYATLHKMPGEVCYSFCFFFEVVKLSPRHIWKPLHTVHSKVKASTSEPLPYLLQAVTTISTLYNFYEWRV